MAYGNSANTNFDSLLTVYRIAVVLQVVCWSPYCTGLTCQSCQPVQSLDLCDSTQMCASNEICRTEIRVYASYTEYKKYCQQDEACRNEETSFASQCTGVSGSVCVTCCDTDLCNAPTADTTAAAVATTIAPTYTDTATAQDTTSTDTATTQGATTADTPTTHDTTSELVTTVTDTSTTRALTTQPATTRTVNVSDRPSPSLIGSLYRLYSSERQVNPQYVTHTSITGSLITCAMACAQTENCKSFGYDSMDGLCYVVGFDNDDISFSRAETCNHYIKGV